MPYYIKLDENGNCLEKVCGLECPEGFIEVNNPENYEVVKPKTYNYTRFMKSMLADDTLRPLAKDPYYAALSDSLRDNNWEGVNAIAQMMIADSESMGSVELFNYFKNKLANEENINL